MTNPATPVEQLAGCGLRLGRELGPPVTEGLERDPLCLAILPLIQITTPPGNMVRPPKMPRPIAPCAHHRRPLRSPRQQHFQ